MIVADLVQTIRPWLDALAIQPLMQFWRDLSQIDQGVLAVLLALSAAAGFLVGRHKSTSGRPTRRFQNQGEALVAGVLRSEFASSNFHLMNHVTLRMGDGTTQIDHILVSRFGVFVIETKHYRGWLLASAEGRRWTQVWFRARFRFQNPILQNRRHVRAVQDVLDHLPPEAIKSVIVFSGSAEFRTEIPSGVLRLHELAGYIRMQADEIMSEKRLQYCVGQLETARLAISDETDVEHLENVARWHGRGASATAVTADTV